jgi:hypothetical protein
MAKRPWSRTATCSDPVELQGVMDAAKRLQPQPDVD